MRFAVTSFLLVMIVSPTGRPTEPRADWWSFQPLARPLLPELRDPRSSVGNPIDAYILARLRGSGLEPGPEAGRATLIRRLYFDLVGLPPAPTDVEAFVADADPLAYERLVDQLLASPHYGERWARHWLDVVHYGETHGYDKDKPRPNAWPYRDYVIRAFNEDKPYSRFVQEQIAGDVLFPGTRDGVEALGFIAAGPWDFIGHVELPETKVDGRIARHLDRDDMAGNAINSFMSLTVQCAQCHDHKFDPITRRDYYSLQAVFAALDRADKPYDLDPDVAARREELEAKRRSALDLAADADTEATSAAAQADLKAIAAELARLPKPRIVYAGTVYTGKGNFTGTGPNGGRARPIHVLRRGDVTQPQEVIDAGAIASVPVGPFAVSGGDEGGRRAALARWIADPANPFVWRSIVNRVWLYHFGRGIVDTPGDFGRMGQRPTHPELLDWLAAELRDGGQSLKRLHRLILTSAAYRRSSAHDDRATAVDSDNRLLWRMNRRKLEAEAVRDAMLAVSGRLHRTMSGPSFQDFVIDKPEHSPHYEYGRHDAEDPRSHRRSVYRMVVRSQPQPFLAALDCADPSMRVDRRHETVTPQQALALLNNRLMVTMARHFAARVEREADGVDGQVSLACRIALGRPPEPRELRALAAYAGEHGLANACRVILNLNEFVFVD